MARPGPTPARSQIGVAAGASSLCVLDLLLDRWRRARARAAAADCTYRVNASTGSRRGPAPDQVANHDRFGSPPRGRIASSSAVVELELDRRARLQRHAQPDARGVLDRRRSSRA